MVWVLSINGYHCLAKVFLKSISYCNPVASGMPVFKWKFADPNMVQYAFDAIVPHLGLRQCQKGTILTQLLWPSHCSSSHLGFIQWLKPCPKPVCNQTQNMQHSELCNSKSCISESLKFGIYDFYILQQLFFHSRNSWVVLLQQQAMQNHIHFHIRSGNIHFLFITSFSVAE